MARPFAKLFYRSKEWQGIREHVMMRDNYLCVNCGAPAKEVHHLIRLNPKNINDKAIACDASNLVSLCRDCHFKEHRQAKVDAVIQSNKKDDVKEGFEFDDEGNLIQSTPPIQK